jgi:hypothetical protein
MTGLSLKFNYIPQVAVVPYPGNTYTDGINFTLKEDQENKFYYSIKTNAPQ